MAKNNPKQRKEITQRITDLALVRIFKKADGAFSATQKQEIQKAFASWSNKKKSDAIAKYIPDFNNLFIKEVVSVIGEIKKKVGKK